MGLRSLRLCQTQSRASSLTEERKAQALGDPIPAFPAPSSVSPKAYIANSYISKHEAFGVVSARAQEGVSDLGTSLAHPALAALPSEEEASLLLTAMSPPCRPLPPPSILQLVLRGRMHKGHGCVHEHGRPLSLAARGGRLGWGVGARLDPTRSKLCPLVAYT